MWRCGQCGMKSELTLTRKTASDDAQAHFLMHLADALDQARTTAMKPQHVGNVSVIPVPVPTNDRVL